MNTDAMAMGAAQAVPNFEGLFRENYRRVYGVLYRLEPVMNFDLEMIDSRHGTKSIPQRCE
jgi:hypothetical protein